MPIINYEVTNRWFVYKANEGRHIRIISKSHYLFFWLVCIIGLIGSFQEFMQVYMAPMHSQTLHKRPKRFFSGVHECVHGADALIN